MTDKQDSEVPKLSEDQFKFYAVSRATDIIGDLLRYGTILGCVYIVSGTVSDLAGLSTYAKFELFFEWVSKDEKSALPWFFTFCTFVWALGERRLRYKKVEHFHKRNKKLELLLDPDRSGSKLTKHGKTNPEDRL